MWKIKTNLNTLQGILLRLQKISKRRWGIEGSTDGRFSNTGVNVWRVVGDQTFSSLAPLLNTDAHDIEKISDEVKKVKIGLIFNFKIFWIVLNKINNIDKWLKLLR